MSISRIVANRILRAQSWSLNNWQAHVELEARDFLIFLAKINVLYRVDYNTIPFGSHGSQEPPKYGVFIQFKNRNDENTPWKCE